MLSIEYVLALGLSLAIFVALALYAQDVVAFVGDTVDTLLRRY
ncbi:MAG: hypothetical protein ABJM18_06870 [Hyphomonas sp.]